MRSFEFPAYCFGKAIVCFPQHCSIVRWRENTALFVSRLSLWLLFGDFCRCFWALGFSLPTFINVVCKQPSISRLLSFLSVFILLAICFCLLGQREYVLLRRCYVFFHSCTPEMKILLFSVWKMVDVSLPLLLYMKGPEIWVLAWYMSECFHSTERIFIHTYEINEFRVGHERQPMRSVRAYFFERSISKNVTNVSYISLYHERANSRRK